MKSHLLSAIIALLSILPIASAQSKPAIVDKTGHLAEIQAGYIHHGAYIEGAYGYSFGNGLMLEGGVGARFWELSVNGNKHSVMVPAFLQVRYAFLDTAFRPFVGIKGGLIANLSEYGAGRFATPQVGFMFKRFALNVGYEWMMCSYRDVTMSWPSGANPYMDPGYISGYSGFDSGRNSLTVGVSIFF